MNRQRRIDAVHRMEEIVSTLKVMRTQEVTSYKCCDYLCENEKITHGKQFRQDQDVSSAPVDADCRYKMSEWCYRVVGYCQLGRELVAIAMSYLDRLLESDVGEEIIKCRRLFQLASMTTLYMAIKIHESESVSPQDIVGLGRGLYTSEDLLDMELDILFALEFRLNPPTAISFVLHLIDLLPFCIQEDESAALREVLVARARLICECVVSEYDFVQYNRFSIAVASIRISLIENLDVKSKTKEQSVESDNNANDEELVLEFKEVNGIISLRDSCLNELESIISLTDPDGIYNTNEEIDTITKMLADVTNMSDNNKTILRQTNNCAVKDDDKEQTEQEQSFMKHVDDISDCMRSTQISPRSVSSKQ